jgi:hypothetical protein
MVRLPASLLGSMNPRPGTFDPDHVLGQVDVLDLEGFEFARPQAGAPAARARSARDLAEEEEPRPWPGSYP